MSKIIIDYNLSTSDIGEINQLIKNEINQASEKAFAYILLSHLICIGDVFNTYLYIGATPSSALDMKAALYDRLVKDGIDIINSVGNSLAILNGPVMYFMTIPEVINTGVPESGLSRIFINESITFPDEVLADMIIECLDNSDDTVSLSDLFVGVGHDFVLQAI